MYTVRFDTNQINSTLRNSISYSYGFLDGAQKNKIIFNKMLGEITLEALNKYIDAQARMDPESLHHVYEWNATGSPGARLFSIEVLPSKNFIIFEGKFLPSSSVSETSDEPFVDKANVMENAISVTIEPKLSDVLVFQDAGQTVFTTKSIYIENPGGDAVAGSFGRVVEDFFDNYFTNALLQPMIQKLSNATEYVSFFGSGAKMGSSVGVVAGKKYITNIGVDLE